MRRSIMILLLVALLLFCIPAVADTNLEPEKLPGGWIVDESWTYVGYIYGGVSFAIPVESYAYDASPYAQMGLLLLYGNDDYMLQLRVFEPETYTYEAFRERIMAEPTSVVRTREYEGTEILIYLNSKPDADSELVGVAMEGIDGKLYKISIFTGDSERFGADAPVWKIAEVIAESAYVRDFSEWGINTEKQE